MVFATEKLQQACWTEGFFGSLLHDRWQTPSSLKAKLTKLWWKLLTPTTEGGCGAGEGFDVKKGGDTHVFQSIVFNRLYFVFNFSISRESLKKLNMERVEGGSDQKPSQLRLGPI
ncbi:uncharacterized protein [Lolium perenne]|uniref:uncharacterized protein n=1 Tax=Lolium perenne TaxID=4522 RepID=UPI003A99A416